MTFGRNDRIELRTNPIAPPASLGKRRNQRELKPIKSLDKRVVIVKPIQMDAVEIEHDEVMGVDQWWFVDVALVSANNRRRPFADVDSHVAILGESKKLEKGWLNPPVVFSDYILLEFVSLEELVSSLSH